MAKDDTIVADETIDTVDTDVISDDTVDTVEADQTVVDTPVADVEIPAEFIEVPLAHHYQIEPGIWIEPGAKIVVPVSKARSLLAAGYLAVDPRDTDAVRAMFGKYRV